MARDYFSVDVQRAYDPSWRSLRLEEQAVVHFIAAIPHSRKRPVSTEHLASYGVERRHLLALLDAEWIDWPSGGVVLSPQALRWIKPATDQLRNWISLQVRTAVYDRDGWACVTCGRGDDLSLDHIQPVSRGGSDDIDNLQTMCRSCNSRKGAKWAG